MTSSGQRIIAVASGKGGAGKTSFSAALAARLAPDCVYADCDVDAANGTIALGAFDTKEEPYFAGPGFSIDPAACSGRGRCAAACRFKANEPTTRARRARAGRGHERQARVPGA